MGTRAPSLFRSFAAACCLAAIVAAQGAESLRRSGEHCTVLFHRGALPAPLADQLADAALAAAAAGPMGGWHTR